MRRGLLRVVIDHFLVSHLEFAAALHAAAAGVTSISLSRGMLVDGRIAGVCDVLPERREVPAIDRHTEGVMRWPRPPMCSR